MTSDSDGSPADPRRAESRTRPGRSNARDINGFTPGPADFAALISKVLVQDSRDALIRLALLSISSLILVALLAGVVIFLASRGFSSSAWILLGAGIGTTFTAISTSVMIRNRYWGDRYWGDR